MIYASREDIEAIIPHREPFLLLTRVLQCDPGMHAVGELDIAPELVFFPGHFPQEPVFPGVLIIESMAQLGAFTVLSFPEHTGKAALFAGIEKARFRRIVRPGETLRLEIILDRVRRGYGRGIGNASVDGDDACEATLSFAIVDWDALEGPSG